MTTYSKVLKMSRAVLDAWEAWEKIGFQRNGLAHRRVALVSRDLATAVDYAGNARIADMYDQASAIIIGAQEGRVMADVHTPSCRVCGWTGEEERNLHEMRIVRGAHVYDCDGEK